MSKIVDIISISLIILAAILFLYLIVSFQLHSPQFVTHEQFYSTMTQIAIAFFSGLLGIWMNVSNKLKGFAEIGEVKRILKQFVKNHPRRK
jgi:hypothetical protein